MHRGHKVTYAQSRDVSFAGDEKALPHSRRVTAGHLPGPGSNAGPLAGAAPGPGPAPAHGQARVLLGSGPQSARAAREFTVATLRGWNLENLAEEAVIIATELVTNAIRHGAVGDGHVELAWQRDAARVICIVVDGSPRPPVLAAADLSAESGRGLQVVQALAASWGWMMMGATQKAVWAALQFAGGVSGLVSWRRRRLSTAALWAVQEKMVIAPSLVLREALAGDLQAS
jgi:Histidine kinase-like ATPase domain